MGLFFKGKKILEETVLKHLLGKGISAIAQWECSTCKAGRTPNYDTEYIKGTRICLWKNLKTGYIIATGDEGNGWDIELAKGHSHDDVINILCRKRLIYLKMFERVS